MTTTRSNARTRASSSQSVEAPVQAVSKGWLPQQVTTFVGRAGEFADLTERLSASRLVTLTGPSGIGKTRLALEVAARLEASYPGDRPGSALTNNEIGEKLFLTGRTVQGHLLRIFPELGVHARRQLRDLDPDS